MGIIQYIKAKLFYLKHYKAINGVQRIIDKIPYSELLAKAIKSPETTKNEIINSYRK